MNLLTMRTKVRRRIDETTAKFWSDAELTDYVNEAYNYYWEWLLQAQHPGTLKTSYITLVNGTASYALPSDFMYARLVERVYDYATVPCEYYERYDTSNRTSGLASNSLIGYLPRYHFEGSNIVLEPTCTIDDVDGIKLTYFYMPTELSGDTDVPAAAMMSIHHGLLVIYAAILAKEKEEAVGGSGSDYGPLLREKAEREQKFKESVELSTIQRIHVEPFGIETC